VILDPFDVPRLLNESPANVSNEVLPVQVVSDYTAAAVWRGSRSGRHDIGVSATLRVDGPGFVTCAVTLWVLLSSGWADLVTSAADFGGVSLEPQEPDREVVVLLETGTGAVEAEELLAGELVGVCGLVWPPAHVVHLFSEATSIHPPVTTALPRFWTTGSIRPAGLE
jgi:hypothetical protein